MTLFNALEYLKNRITTLSLNHKISNRDIAQLEVKGIVMGIETHVIPTLEKSLERAKKVEGLLGLYKELGGIEQDIEYLCGLRDCMIEFSVEKPMEHIYSGIKEYKEKRDGLNYQIKQLEKELLDKEVGVE